jgi:XRE family transcriptional regulator, fatty acid utilization regulator
MAYHSLGTSPTHCSITICLLATPTMREKINFFDDPQVPSKQVGVTCQRCSWQLCAERAAPPTLYEKEQYLHNLDLIVEKLLTNS